MHKKYRISSNLIFLTLVLAILYPFLPGIEQMAGMEIFRIGSLVLVLGLGILVRLGFVWAKYLLLILVVGQVLGLPDTLVEIGYNPIGGFVSLASTVLLIASVVILFVPTRKSRQETIDDVSNG